MKKLILIAFVILSAFCFAQTKSILFIGNSYTYYNGGVDVMLKNIALAEGDTLYTESLTAGGASFSTFCNNPETFARIRSRAWDYVVLQEQSQLPTFPPSQVEAECYPYAKQLCDSIHANDSCTQILFFMTWGRENGDQSNCANYPPLCTYDGMQQRLRESYVQMADDNNASVVPVGLAWKYVRDHYPEINLYQSDESHPTLEGTYLAALTFYNAIIYYDGYSYAPESFEQFTALHIYVSVEGAIRNNSEECNLNDLLFAKLVPLGIYAKSTDPTYHINIDVSQDFDSCVCDFGNGVSHTFLPNDEEVYAENGFNNSIYVKFKKYLGDIPSELLNVCATVYRGDCSVTDCKEFLYDYSMVIGGIAENLFESLNFTNPVTNGKLQFDSDVTGNYEIYSIEGRLLDSGFVSGSEIDVSQLKQGMYLIRIGERTEKFVVGN